jgi:hypothetical protein
MTVMDSIYHANLSRGGAILVPQLDVSDLLVAGDQAYAAANAAAIQAVIASMVADGAYRPIAVQKAGSYYMNQVLCFDHTHIVIGANVEFVKPDDYPPCMFINEGALNTPPTSNTDIRFTGDGRINGNKLNQPGLTRAKLGAITVNTFLYGIQGEISMINVTDYECAIKHPYECRGFFTQFVGTNGHFHGMRPDTGLDFLHINGPTNHVVIEDCKGFSSDDFIALNAWDWHQSAPTTGVIQDVSIHNCAYYGSNGVGDYARTGMMTKFLSGTRVTGDGANGLAAIRNVRIDGFRYDPTVGTATAPAEPAFGIIGDYDQVNGSEYSGVGLVEDVTIKGGEAIAASYLAPFFSISKTAGSGADADGQVSINVRRFTVQDTFVDCSKGQANCYNPVSINMPYTTCTLNDIVFRDMDWTPAPLDSDQGFITLANKDVIDSFEVDGLTINENPSASASTAVVLVDKYDATHPCIVDDFTVDRIKTSHGYAMKGAWLRFNGGANNFRSRGVSIVGAGDSSVYGSGIYFNSSVAFCKRGVISQGKFTNVLMGVNIDAVSSVGVTMQYDDCNLINMSHPVFVNGTYTCKVAYRGGNVDTSTNLVNSAGNLTVSYEGTTSSGGGATTLTRSAGTLRALKVDQIVLPAAAPLNPANNDLVNFAGTPSGATGTGAGMYMRTTTAWKKLN